MQDQIVRVGGESDIEDEWCVTSCEAGVLILAITSSCMDPRLCPGG
jgi:hypothetical protein